MKTKILSLLVVGLMLSLSIVSLFAPIAGINGNRNSAKTNVSVSISKYDSHLTSELNGNPNIALANGSSVNILGQGYFGNLTSGQITSQITSSMKRGNGFVDILYGAGQNTINFMNYWNSALANLNMSMPEFGYGYVGNSSGKAGPIIETANAVAFSYNPFMELIATNLSLSQLPAFVKWVESSERQGAQTIDVSNATGALPATSIQTMTNIGKLGWYTSTVKNWEGATTGELEVLDNFYYASYGSLGGSDSYVYFASALTISVMGEVIWYGSTAAQGASSSTHWTPNPTEQMGSWYPTNSGTLSYSSSTTTQSVTLSYAGFGITYSETDPSGFSASYQDYSNPAAGYQNVTYSFSNTANGGTYTVQPSSIAFEKYDISPVTFWVTQSVSGKVGGGWGSQTIPSINYEAELTPTNAVKS